MCILSNKIPQKERIVFSKGISLKKAGQTAGQIPKIEEKAGQTVGQIPKTEEKAGQTAGQASETDIKAGQGAGQASEIDIKAGQALESEEIILVDFLAKNPRSNIREIAQKLVLSKSAVDRLIKNLKLKKLSNALEPGKKAIGRF